MKIGILVGTNDPELVWNSPRFRNTVLHENHIKGFLD
jgi:hypothetical protein